MNSRRRELTALTHLKLPLPYTPCLNHTSNNLLRLRGNLYVEADGEVGKQGPRTCKSCWVNKEDEDDERVGLLHRCLKICKKSLQMSRFVRFSPLSHHIKNTQ